MTQNLYRHFDGSGTLLYVGVSLNAAARLAQHKDHSGWFDTIAEVKIQKFETRQEALAAEFIAVQKENPVYNKRLKKKWRQPEPDDDAAPSEGRSASVTRNIVTFSAINTLDQTARILNMTVPRVKQLIAAGEIGFLEMEPPRLHQTKSGPRIISRRYISGWQIIEFIEAKEKREGAARARVLKP